MRVGIKQPGMEASSIGGDPIRAECRRDEGREGKGWDGTPYIDGLRARGKYTVLLQPRDSSTLTAAFVPWGFPID
jgi:hypothetical protein